MMTHVFRNCLFLAILLICTTSQLKAQEILLNDSAIQQLPEEFYLFKPIYKSPLQVKTIQPTTYTVSKISKDNFIENLSLGTYLVCFESVTVDSITTINLYKEFSVIQLISKKSEGYIGYLEELINVPFVLPPKKMKEGHQTDLRLGVDCAELAIYGRRRMGYQIPYIGPRGIGKYLTETDSIERGTVINFGNNTQISVIYEDRGIIGVLDKEDLLIHAYKDKAEIIPFGETDLSKYHYKIYRWKE